MAIMIPPDCEVFRGERAYLAKGLQLCTDVIVNKLRDAAKLAVNDERVKSVINASGSPIQYLDAPEFSTYWAKDANRMAETVKKIGKVE